MNLKTILLTIVLVAGISFQSCSDDDCICCVSGGGELKAFFDIQDMEVKHLDSGNVLIEENQIRFDDYGFINLNFIVDYIVEQHNNSFSFSLMSTAYACSIEPLDPGYEGSKEEAIESLQVISLNDFDDNHKAGDSINDLLVLDRTDQGVDPLPLEDFLNDFTENVPNENFLLRLTKEPTLNKDFQVKVVISLSTGENYDVTSDLIRFI